MTILLFIAGLAFLVVGAEVLVRGASQIAAGIGIPPLIIGLTVVAFGTSSPELAVSVKSAYAGQANIALGNVVGSNIFNVLFILGLSALIVPLQLSKQLIRLDVPLMIALSALVLFFAGDLGISQFEGSILLLGLVVYTSFLIYHGRKPSMDNRDPLGSDTNKDNRGQTVWFRSIAFIIGGLFLLVLGSRWLVDGAVIFSQYLGVSDLVIGLTIVAAGTSMPEVVTSIIAAVRGERDIAVGNVVGSNIFNIMGVLGIAGILAPSGIAVAESTYYFDIPIMIAAAFACLPIFFTGGKINRWEGGLLIGYYAAYTVYLIAAATHHEALSFISNTMLYFVIPITVITLAVTAIQEYRGTKSLSE